MKVRDDLEGLTVKVENGGRNTAGAESLSVVITWGVKNDSNGLIEEGLEEGSAMDSFIKNEESTMHGPRTVTSAKVQGMSMLYETVTSLHMWSLRCL